jgi:putative addiction module component (TIGR02574 family)
MVLKRNIDMPVETIESKALKLPLQARSKLALALLESLDGADRKEIEQLWYDEAERRVRAYEAGKVKTVTAAKAFARARRALRK